MPPRQGQFQLISPSGPIRPGITEWHEHTVFRSNKTRSGPANSIYIKMNTLQIVSYLLIVVQVMCPAMRFWRSWSFKRCTTEIIMKNSQLPCLSRFCLMRIKQSGNHLLSSEMPNQHITGTYAGVLQTYDFTWAPIKFKLGKSYTVIGAFKYGWKLSGLIVIQTLVLNRQTLEALESGCVKVKITSRVWGTWI